MDQGSPVMQQQERALPADAYEKVFTDMTPLCGKVYVHHVHGQCVITTCFDPRRIGPQNILARIEPFTGPHVQRPSDYEKIIADNIAYAINLERGQL